jgi:hypothetical protein
LRHAAPAAKNAASAGMIFSVNRVREEKAFVTNCSMPCFCECAALEAVAMTHTRCAHVLSSSKVFEVSESAAEVSSADFTTASQSLVKKDFADFAAMTFSKSSPSSSRA